MKHRRKLYVENPRYARSRHGFEASQSRKIMAGEVVLNGPDSAIWDRGSSGLPCRPLRNVEVIL